MLDRTSFIRTWQSPSLVWQEKPRIRREIPETLVDVQQDIHSSKTKGRFPGLKSHGGNLREDIGNVVKGFEKSHQFS